MKAVPPAMFLRQEEGGARPWVGASERWGDCALWQPSHFNHCASCSVAMRPPGGRVGRHPDWSPGRDSGASVARNGFPAQWAWRGQRGTFQRRILWAGPRPARENTAVSRKRQDQNAGLIRLPKTRPSCDERGLSEPVPVAPPKTGEDIFDTHPCWRGEGLLRCVSRSRPAHP